MRCVLICVVVLAFWIPLPWTGQPGPAQQGPPQQVDYFRLWDRNHDGQLTVSKCPRAAAFNSGVY